MALQNQISVAFTDDELKQIDEHIAGIEAIVKQKVVPLTAAQNSLYGKLGNENESWAETVYADCKQVPKLVPTDVVDVAEWDKDEVARKQLSPRVSRLEALISDIEGTNRLLGFDIYNTCLTVYKYGKTMMDLGVAGFKKYYEKWSVQFPGRKGGPKSTKP